jgi:hypothetical protein
MKLQLKTLAALAVFTLAVTSCSEKDEGDGVPFSQKSVEENKMVVENSAIEVAQTIDEMKDLETTDAAVSLGNLLDKADPLESKTNKKSKVSATIGVIAGIQTGDNSIHDIFTVMKSSGELGEDPETLQEIWDEVIGTYSWNAETMTWDYAENADKVVFEFPSTDGGMSNDAALTVSNYAGIYTSNPLEAEYSGDLPASLNMDLKVGSKTLIDYVFSAEYNSDGVPTKVASDLTFESFMFTVDLTNSNTEVSANYKFTHGEKTIMEIAGSAQGDFSNANIEANTETYTDTWTWTDYVYNENTGRYEEVEVTETDEWEEVHGEEIARSANAKFQVVDIAIMGEVNIKALVDELDQIYPDDYWDQEDFDEKAAVDKEAEVINKYLNLYAVNVVANEKIAEAEAYVVQETYGGDYYDYWVDLRLKFGDGSFVDMDTYMEEGFEDFIKEINAMITELNGEYNWELEAIDY